MLTPTVGSRGANARKGFWHRVDRSTLDRSWPRSFKVEFRRVQWRCVYSGAAASQTSTLNAFAGVASAPTPHEST
eukprot:1539755-Pyramimonas_sp.AAC.1